MTQQQLTKAIHDKSSFLCVGLDVDLDKIPPHLLESEDPIFAFNKAIIDATHHLAVAYKPNTAFYESYGTQGWQALEKTIDYLNSKHPEIFTIADAKRGDIGNTSTRYAKAFFDQMGFDALTIAPYMGRDSVEPFLEFDDKFVILLALTSNPGAFDFQVSDSAQNLFEQVLETAQTYKNRQRLMFVVGATKTEYLARVRAIAPKSFLLVPGVGAQGGSLKEVCGHALNDEVGLLVNSSRGIIYASQGKDFAQAAAAEALKLQQQMQTILQARMR
jgi:orotidine-5'-phosphate decarboxylase